MRALPAQALPSFVALAILLPALSGCLTAQVDPASIVGGGLTLEAVPEGAVVESIAGGLRLVLSVDLPFEQNVTIPAGTTLVRAFGLVGPEESIGVSMRHAETQRRRCNLAGVDAWDAPVLGRAQCSGVAIVDRLPDQWAVRAASSVASKATVQVEFLSVPLDGILAQLDLGQLSMREHELEETKVETVPSFDGTNLHVEVTLPKGAGPWPAVLWSSPYDYPDRLAGRPSAWNYFANDWAQRGYAVVTADVRGYAESDGCVEVWSVNEQKDQAFLVDWIAQQGWSDGNVGFYGQSYVATTPVEAAVQAPDALKAIVIVAPVNDAYQDWHFGGVPNGENSLSPSSYMQLGGGVAVPPAGSTNPDDYIAWAGEVPYMADRLDNGFCAPTTQTGTLDPRALYDAYYEERNFSARAADIKAAVLYTQGFEDSNVKSQMIPDFFNALTAPKLGLFGHWVHQHPTRADNEVLMLLWLDQYVKGKPVGFERVQGARIIANDGTERAAAAWPAPDAAPFVLAADLAANALAPDAAESEATIWLDPVGASVPVVGAGIPQLPLPVTRGVTLTSEPLAAPVRFGGQGVVALTATLENAENGYVAAYLREVQGDESRLVTWGMFNLAHRNGHDTYAPVAPGETLHIEIPLLPTEWVFAEGATLTLEIRGAAMGDWALVNPGEPAQLTIVGGADGTRLVLPTVDGGAALPATAQR